ncbi:uncharacterized protein [Lolium perenne]|uniref:uncharacterized protein n=1 Tax=Lolium perenne TaxID=4522 RepID=UPI003A99C582
MDVHPRSSHRDGSIYECTHAWKKHYHVADRGETSLEAMSLTHPNRCVFLNGNCRRHPPNCMFQIFSLKLAKAPVDGGLVQLYGYIAVRDNLDPLLNYVVSVSRDDPIILEQGSSIKMAGPKRGIDLCGNILIEYDMKIKTDGQEKHDLQVIDGASLIRFKDMQNCQVITNRIGGDCGAIDITASGLEDAVEATIEILLSEVRTGFNLCLSCFPSELKQEIQIFDGAVSERGLKSSVVAVVIGSFLSFKFKVDSESSGSIERQCSFRANNHGVSTQNIKTDIALISAKVTWSALPQGH